MISSSELLRVCYSLGAFQGDLGVVWEPLGAHFGGLGALFGGLGVVLGRSWGLLGHFLEVLGWSLEGLGPSWGDLGGHFAARWLLFNFLMDLGVILAPQRAPKMIQKSIPKRSKIDVEIEDEKNTSWNGLGSISDRFWQPS